MSPALEISALTVRIGGDTILEDISLSLPMRSFLGILGPNGAGKSVLLKTILGEYKPTSGSIRIFGHPPHRARGQVAYVPQFSDFDPEFPIQVRSVVLTGRLHKARWLHRYSSRDHDIATEAMARTKLSLR